ncbi:hypothetical protein N7462_004923 [Penicillium macrosclerotiorum]|uniref:uncharacterized protein n=1 Tax=Penicillium macrosclerotiorum TaxID=303699 RepID=UPI002549B34A|nr:uncharacterized protein N7462_004923 [Penicillium macrosclerotiorum]KAJ5690531.1 hypothetical protein N7462_004923 [Penicillium macrosclerotiorum]
MGRSLTGTVIITGGNGLLGSEIAVAIAKTQPFTHLLLTARNPQGDDVRQLISRIRLIGPRSIERTDGGACSEEGIPPVADLIHSAAIASYTIDELTLDGYDPVYQTNCVAPFFLTVGLLEAFRAGDGSPDGGAKVINIGCAASSYGRLDYFDHNQGRDTRPPGTVLSAKEGNVRFGSSKLLASVALYALRRSLASVSSAPIATCINNTNLPGPRPLRPASRDPGHVFSFADHFSPRDKTDNISLDIFTLDPGGMAGQSHLRTGAPLSVRVAHQTRSGLRPILRMVSRSSINKANVPAKAIAKVAFRRTVDPGERYFILDSEYEAASVLATLRDGARMESLLVQMMHQVEAGCRAKGSPVSISSTPTTC